MLLYRGETLFARAIDDPPSLAKTVLGVIISCMFGGPTFISKVLSIAKLNLPLYYEQIQHTVDAINLSPGRVKSVICDGNRNNQTCLDCLIQNHSNHG